MRGCTCSRHTPMVLCPACQDILDRVEGKPAQVVTHTREADLLAQVRRAALDLGFLFYHTHRSDKSEPGLPDCLIVHPTRPGPVYGWELKSATGKVSVAQQVWLDALDGRTISTAVYRPSDLGVMRACLRRHP